MLNHSVHAQEDLKLLLQAVSPSHIPLSAKAMGDVCQLLKTAVKFELPDNGIVTDRVKSLEILEPHELRLPFPIVALEYCCPKPAMTPDMIAAKKRIALCFDYEANVNSYVAQQAAKLLPAIASVGGLIVVPCYYSEVMGRWCVLTSACILLKSNVPGVKTLRLEVGGKAIASRLNVTSFPCLPELVVEMIRRYGSREAARSATIDIWDEMMAVITMITALSCSNVEIESHAAPAPLNKKRIRNGREPFCDYKKITVITSWRQSRRNGDNTAIPGRRVRTHLRRGHVRRLSDGRRIWVENCVVNADRGRAESRYRVKPANNLRLAA